MTALPVAKMNGRGAHAHAEDAEMIGSDNNPLEAAGSNGHRMAPWGSHPTPDLPNAFISRCQKDGCGATLVLHDPAEAKPVFSGDAPRTECPGK